MIPICPQTTHRLMPAASEYRGAPGRRVRIARTARRGAQHTVILLHPTGRSVAAAGNRVTVLASASGHLP